MNFFSGSSFFKTGVGKCIKSLHFPLLKKPLILACDVSPYGLYYSTLWRMAQKDLQYLHPELYLKQNKIIHKSKRRSWKLFLGLQNSISMSKENHFKLIPIISLFQAYFTNIKVPFLWQHLESKGRPLYYQLTIMNLFLNLVLNREMLIQ